MTIPRQLCFPWWILTGHFYESSVNSVAPFLFELPLGIWFNRFKLSLKLQLDEAIKLACAQKTVGAENMASSGSLRPWWKESLRQWILGKLVTLKIQINKHLWLKSFKHSPQKCILFWLKYIKLNMKRVSWYDPNTQIPYPIWTEY